MNLGIVVSALVLVLGGCGKKKDQVADRPAGSGSGSGGSAAAPGSSSGSAGSGSAVAGGADAKVIARGEYLANILGCGFCHMGMGPQGPDPTRAFAGGLEVPDRIGTWRSPNITQHAGSGIGGWTDAQIAASIREGVRPDGAQMFPIMPYLNYNRLTDADTTALVAYLRTVPPIDNVVAPTKDLKMPKVPAPKPANAPDVTDDPRKHGEYLVTLMHCNACHGTTNGGPPDPAVLGGGMPFDLPFMGTGTLYASNITSDPDTGIGTWSVDDIAKAIKTMTRPDGSVIQGPMQLYLAGWSKLDERDVQAIATFVKALPAVKNKVPASTFKPHQGPPPGSGAGSGSGSAAK